MKLWKFLVPLSICLVLVLVLLPTTANAATSGYYTYTITNGEATITDCSTSIRGDITIPARLGGYPVTTIGNDAFEWCSHLTSVTIPDNVSTIGNFAFYNCERLITVTMGNSVTTIGDDAFAYCDSLTSITIPDTVTTIGKSAFYNCTSLTYTIYENCKYLGNTNNPHFALVDTISSSITQCTIHSDTKIIGDFAFDWCESLSSVTIPDNVITVGQFAFNGCGTLTGIWVDEKNLSYSSDSKGILFNKNKSTLIEAPGGLNGSYVIPNSVTTIGEEAFYYCRDLTDVVIPNSVSTIGAAAFYNCTSLSDVTIPSSVHTIGNNAFINCTRLTTITIPDSVTAIGENVFSYCNKLSGIWVDEKNPSYSSDSKGVLFNKDKSTLIEAPTPITNYTIPDSVTTIGYKAFYCCINLTSMEIPTGVTTLGEYAFSNCDRLTSVTIPEGVITISLRAFDNCTRLTSVTIPASVTAIDDYAFCSCDYLAHVWYAGSKEDRQTISIGDANSDLTLATWHYDNCYIGAVHTYDNVCDTDCNVCGHTRTITHAYDNSCDTVCNVCNATRTAPHSYESELQYDDDFHWRECTICKEKADRQDHIYEADGRCTVCAWKKWTPGNVDGDEKLTTGDAVYLLLSVMFGTEDYPVPDGMNLDFDGNGAIGTDDAVYLLLHVMFGSDDYPLRGDIVPEGYIAIYKKEDLDALNVNGKYIMMCDIDMGYGEWAQIGTETNPFVGDFNGNGYCIKNIRIASTPAFSTCSGLFGYNSGTIRNLGIENLTAQNYATISGGLVAVNNGTVSSCYVTGKISSTGYILRAGGLAGVNNGTINNCYALCDVSGTATYDSAALVGGLVGKNDGEISNSYASGKIQSTSEEYAAYAGCLVGQQDYYANEKAMITNCFATGEVQVTAKKSSWAGGIIGWSNGTVGNCWYGKVRFTVKQGYTISWDPTNIYGIDVDDVTLKTVAFQSQTLGWDTSIWNMVEGSYPTLK